uniref:Anaphylatoxin-like domain-containing protein n=1 Tax=Otus sunia TaxID=257818 RepID=A0A8C8AM55_9STRI
NLKRKLRIENLGSSKYQNTDLQKCCEDGMKLNPMRFSCAQRLTRVTVSPECRNAFQDCCEKATALRKEAKQRIRVGLARRKEQWHAIVYRKILFI